MLVDVPKDNSIILVLSVLKTNEMRIEWLLLTQTCSGVISDIWIYYLLFIIVFKFILMKTWNQDL